MFERYTERARRVIFFARYEASRFGSTTIETDHLLLGMIKELGSVLNRFLLDGSSPESIRAEIEKGLEVRAYVSTSIDLPLSNECKRILAYSAEEAERLASGHIDTEHMLLGMLREQGCGAERVLSGHGLRIDSTREQLARRPMSQALDASHKFDSWISSLQAYAPLRSPLVPDAETAMRIAEAVWIPRCGEEVVKGQMPFHAELKHNVWIVTGSAPAGETQSALFAFILQLDGRIIHVGPGTTSM